MKICGRYINFSPKNLSKQEQFEVYNMRKNLLGEKTFLPYEKVKNPNIPKIINKE